MAISSSVCAVVITYHPNPVQLEKLVKITLQQVSCLVVIDNGSRDDELSSVLRMSQDDRMTGLSVVQLGENIGVAAAQNKGIHWAKERSCSYILLLDQDSLPSENMASRLLSVYTALSQKHRVAAVGPVFRDTVTGNGVSFMQTKGAEVCSNNQCVPVDILISSGSLIRMSVFRDVKTMDEPLFIDNIDTEWCLRAKAKGYQSFGISDTILYHSLGDKTYKIWFGRWRHVPQHKPIRHYYQFRNSLLLYRRSYIPFQWKIKNLIKLIYLFVFGMIWMPERHTRFALMVRGICDGIYGRAGKLEV
jgi:rhamnosyltransferase